MRLLIRTEKEREEFIRRIREVRLDGSKPFVAEFKVFRKKRSLAQNRLFWMWMRCIRTETGNDIETLHDYFCEKYLPWSEYEVFGEPVRRVAGTKDMNTKEFTDFLENIRLEMLNEQGIYLPQPGEPEWDEFYARYSKED